MSYTNDRSTLPICDIVLTGLRKPKDLADIIRNTVKADCWAIDVLYNGEEKQKLRYNDYQREPNEEYINNNPEHPDYVHSERRTMGDAFRGFVADHPEIFLATIKWADIYILGENSWKCRIIRTDDGFVCKDYASKGYMSI